MPNDGNIFTPATGLTDGFNVEGAGSTGEASWHPDISMADRGAEASGMKDTEPIAGVGATKGAVDFAQLATNAPDSYDTSGDPMVGGIGTPPRP